MKTAVATKTKWVIDPMHSEILFKVKHLMISNVKGEFRKFTGEIDGEDFTKSEINVNIDAGSIFTNEDSRDNHLKSADFFDVTNHPTLTFRGLSLEKNGSDTYKLNGLLTIRGITNEITLDVDFGGVNKDPYGNEKAGFSLTGSISRKNFGLTWNAALETGGALVGDEVKIMAEVQLVKQAA
ncbi:polyisoprenoid-binding protein [Cytophagales bacterium WSM2-2]|nr:polyisoprenoid-binding protein [Cytophagales bacterium WSM2-2]